MSAVLVQDLIQEYVKHVNDARQVIAKIRSDIFNIVTSSETPENIVELIRIYLITSKQIKVKIPASLDQLRQDTESLLDSGTLSNDGKNMLCATAGIQLREITKVTTEHVKFYTQIVIILGSESTPARKVELIAELVT